MGGKIVGAATVVADSRAYNSWEQEENSGNNFTIFPPTLNYAHRKINYLFRCE